MNSKLKKHNEKTQNKPTPKTAKRIGTSIKKEYIRPQDYLKYDHRFSCEDCTYFKTDVLSCSLGFKTDDHRKEAQEKAYHLSGKIAFCRFLEID